MASCTISPGQEVTDIYSQCYYDQARADRAAKCAEYRSGVQYRVCRVIITGCTVQGVPCYHYRVCSTGCAAWNNGKEVPRWGVTEILKMSPSTTGLPYWSHEISADQSPSRNCICSPVVVELVYLQSRHGRTCEN